MSPTLNTPLAQTPLQFFSASYTKKAFCEGLYYVRTNITEVRGGDEARAVQCIMCYTVLQPFTTRNKWETQYIKCQTLIEDVGEKV